eukprot:c13222_g1_i1.p1 GENE.c13222_g1_i1~~c13222_g1_i1.p1  ORF type:complete len:185 (+),score=-3.40 c13222_g1_i1:68-622(+)
MKVANYENRIKIGTEDDSEFQEILEEMQYSSNLEEIYLGGNCLTAANIFKLSGFLISFHDLKILSLRATDCFNGTNNQLAIDSIKTILGDHPKLEILRLSYNRIRDTDLHALLNNNSSELTQKIKSVTLDLSCNLIQSISIAKKFLSETSMMYLKSGNPTTLKRPTQQEEGSSKKKKTSNITFL